MKFSVKYRRTDGGLDFIEVEAESRAAAYQILEKRGMMPVKDDACEEKSCGWNRPTTDRSSAAQGNHYSHTVVKGALAGLLVVVLFVGAYWGLHGSFATEESEAQNIQATIEEVVPAQTKKEVPTPREKKVRAKPKTAEEALASFEVSTKQEIKKRELTPEEWNRLTNRVFKTGTEQLMSWIFTTEVGDMPMPIPPISQEDRENIVGMLISKNEIKESDSDRIQDCKAQVDLAKKEMMNYLKEGGDPDDFLQYYYKELKNSFELRQEAIRLAEELYEEDPKAGAEYVDKINEKFSNEGIKLIRKEQFEE